MAYIIVTTIKFHVGLGSVGVCVLVESEEEYRRIMGKLNGSLSKLRSTIECLVLKEKIKK